MKSFIKDSLFLIFMVKVKKKPYGDIMILELSGKLMGGPDHEKVREEIKSNIRAGFIDYVFDMRGVTWVNSTGLGVLNSANHAVKKEGGRITACCLSDKLGPVIARHIEFLFPTYRSLEESLDDHYRYDPDV